MKKLINALDWLLYRFVALCLITEVVICFLQVFTRYVMNSALSWANEISIAIATWAIWLSVCLLIKRKLHLRVDLFEKWLSQKTQIRLRMIFNILTLGFMGFIGYSSQIVTGAMSDMRMVSIQSIPLNAVYLSIPVGAVFVILFVIQDLMDNARALTKTSN